MDLSTLVTFISSVGFPIVACCALFWQNTKMTDAINNNTQALRDLQRQIENEH